MVYGPRPFHRFRRAGTWPLVLAFLVACGPSEDAPAGAALEPETQAAVDSSVAAVDTALQDVPRLTDRQVAALRRNLNEAHVTAARALGVEPVQDSAEVRRLVRDGALEELEDSTRYWVVRELDHSVPYVTPDTRALLVEIGQRFHAHLDSLGLPPFRYEISSVLRTSAMQAELRQGNSNASRTTSSHEFGTTVDIAYNEFSAPAESAARALLPSDRAVRDPDVRGEIHRVATPALDSVATERASELQGVLGRVLEQLQAEGLVLPLRERAQPVFHLTVAEELAARTGTLAE